jgi:hypothetical protein
VPHGRAVLSRNPPRGRGPLRDLRGTPRCPCGRIGPGTVSSASHGFGVRSCAR